jgi:hypothetical protein
MQGVIKQTTNFFSKLQPITSLLTKKFKVPNPLKIKASCPTRMTSNAHWKNIAGICYNCPNGFHYNAGLSQCQENAVPKCRSGFKELTKDGNCRTCMEVRGRMLGGRRRRRRNGFSLTKVAKSATKSVSKAANKVVQAVGKSIRCRGLRKASSKIPNYNPEMLELTVQEIIDKFVNGLKKIEKLPLFKEIMKLFTLAMKPIEALINKALSPVKKLVKEIALPPFPVELLKPVQKVLDEVAELKEGVEAFAAKTADEAKTVFDKAMQPVPMLPCSS